jgi:hypothetical protein
MTGWWIEVRTDHGTPRPYMPCKEAVQTQESGKEYFGPYHCPACANWCASMGKTERQAFEIVHLGQDCAYDC